MTIDTAPIATLLAQLNTLREANGKKPLSGWKNSKSELIQRIADETPTPNADAKATHPTEPDLKAIIETLPEDVPVTKVPTGESTLAKQKRAAKAQAKQELRDIQRKKDEARRAARAAIEGNKEATKRTKVIDHLKTPRTPAGKGEFAKYLEEVGITGRVARAKLRRAGIKTNADKRYDLTDEVKAALSADNRKKQ